MASFSPLVAQLESLIHDLETTNGSNEKVEILRKHRGLCYLLGVILDPLRKTGVTRGGLLKYEATKYPRFASRHSTYPTQIDEILHALVQKVYTGDEAKEMVIAAVRKMPLHRDMILRVAEKDLKTRLGIGIYRQAFYPKEDDETTTYERDPTGKYDDSDIEEADARPKKKAKLEKLKASVKKKDPGESDAPYKCALARDLQKMMKYFQKSLGKGDQWMISRKLDGVRCQVWNTVATTTAKSREGRPFASLGALESLVRSYMQAGYVLDGEICVVEDDGSESFKKAVSHVKRKTPMVNFCYCLIDVLTEQEFRTGKSALTLSERRRRGEGVTEALLKVARTGNQRIRWIDQIPYSEEALTNWQSISEAQNWEGLILRRDAAYSGKRTNDLLKVKRFFTEEYPIESVSTGPFRVIDPKTGLEKIIDTVTAVQIRHKGQYVSVGSGFTLEDRAAMYADRSGTIGKVIAVQYFEESTDKNGKVSLRFPTFKHRYGSVRDV